MWRAGRELFGSYPALCALGVVYVSFPGATGIDTTLLEKVREVEGEAVFRLRDAPGRLYAVPRVVATGNEVATVALMTSDRFAPREAAVAADAAAAGEYPGSSRCDLRWAEDEPDRVAFDIEAPESALVVLADTFFSGWHARVEDAQVPIHRVNQVARGVAVPAGRHRVTMRYVPEGWTATVPVTRSAMLVWLAFALALAAWSMRRR